MDVGPVYPLDQLITPAVLQTNVEPLAVGKAVGSV
jgi:hypothetical protein